MEVRVTTESGSVYLLNKNKMTWNRIRLQPYADFQPLPVRTPDGLLTEWPEINVGRGMDLIGPSLTPEATVRIISTSYVTKIEEVSAN